MKIIEKGSFSIFFTVQISIILDQSSKCAIYSDILVPSVNMSKNVRIIIIALRGIAKRLASIKYDGINPK
ncbi:hypothetical protein MASR1M46_06830 [Bacteroidales bacterium]